MRVGKIHMEWPRDSWWYWDAFAVCGLHKYGLTELRTTDKPRRVTCGRCRASMRARDTNGA